MYKSQNTSKYFHGTKNINNSYSAMDIWISSMMILEIQISADIDNFKTSTKSIHKPVGYVPSVYRPSQSSFKLLLIKLYKVQ